MWVSKAHKDIRGSPIQALPSVRCDPKTSPNVSEGRKHRHPLGGSHGSATKCLTYPIPELLVHFLLCKEESYMPQKDNQMIDRRRDTRVHHITQEQEEPKESFEEMAWKVEGHLHKKHRSGVCEARDAETHPLAVKAKEEILQEFGKTSLSGIYPKDPPVRGPFGAAEIWLKPNAIPVVQHPYRIGGERGKALGELVDKAMTDHKLEPSTGVWNLPAFPVAKNTPGKFRLVQNSRPLNDATVKDAHPLPRIVAYYTRKERKMVQVGPGRWLPSNAFEGRTSTAHMHVSPAGYHAMECPRVRNEKRECTIPKDDGVGA